MLSLQEAIEAVEAVEYTEAARKRIPDHLKATHPYSVNALWTFYLDAHHQPKTESCPYCIMFDGQTFTGDQLRTVFPDHTWEGDDIRANVHETLWGTDTCACLLIREPEDGPNISLDMWDGIGGDWKNKLEQ